MTTLVILLWLAGSVLAFLALRHFALRDFGEVTVGAAVGLALFSLITPCALCLAFFLSLSGRTGYLGKTIWTKDGLE